VPTLATFTLEEGDDSSLCSTCTHLPQQQSSSPGPAFMCSLIRSRWVVGRVAREWSVVESFGGRAGKVGGWTDVMTEAVMVVGFSGLVSVGMVPYCTIRLAYESIPCMNKKGMYTLSLYQFLHKMYILLAC
jgi:hypothetical protein